MKVFLFDTLESHPRALYIESQNGGHLGFYEGGFQINSIYFDLIKLIFQEEF